MTSDQAPHLFYLVLLALFIGSYFLYSARGKFTRTLQQALVWLGIFAMAVIGYGYRDVLHGQLLSGGTQSLGEGTVTLTRSTDGHFYADVAVNGAPTRFIVDTGASSVVLTRDAAEGAGLNPAALRYSSSAATANGIVRIAPVRLDELRFGNFTDRNVVAAVNGGELFESLLGMSYLERFDRIEIRGNTMILVR